MPLRLVAILLLCFGAQARNLAICVEDRVGLGSHARAALHSELAILIGAVQAGCGDTAVRVSVRYQAPPEYAAALGLARREGPRILPRLEIFLDPVLRLLGPARSAEVVGRALARVTAHEVAHFVLQQSGHEERGLMKERFPGHLLADSDPTPFLLARSR